MAERPHEAILETREHRVRESFRAQARHCERLGSPFTALVCSMTADRLDPSTKVGRRILEWEGAPESEHDALAIRFAGCLHMLARSGAAPALSSCYPPHRFPSEDELWRAIELTFSTAEDRIIEWLKHPPQTNEVGRSALLMSGLLVAAQAQPWPITLLEIGSSAGLNLLLDRYHHRLGATQAGDPSSSLLLAPEWIGESPSAVPVEIRERGGVDIQPLDVTATSDRERLAAFTWADQAQRLRQLQHALDIAAAAPPEIERGHALQWLARQLDQPGPSGTLRVVMHSFVQQYLSAADQATLVELIGNAGAKATHEAPLAWLSLEMDSLKGRPALSLQLWPAGGCMHLAWCAPHGQWVEWIATG